MPSSQSHSALCWSSPIAIHDNRSSGQPQTAQAVRKLTPRCRCRCVNYPVPTVPLAAPVPCLIRACSIGALIKLGARDISHRHRWRMAAQRQDAVATPPPIVDISSCQITKMLCDEVCRLGHHFQLRHILDWLPGSLLVSYLRIPTTCLR